MTLFFAIYTGIDLPLTIIGSVTSTNINHNDKAKEELQDIVDKWVIKEYQGYHGYIDYYYLMPGMDHPKKY